MNDVSRFRHVYESSNDIQLVIQLRKSIDDSSIEVDDQVAKDIFNLIASRLSVPEYFDSMREEKVYDNPAFTTHLNQAQAFINEAEEKWKLILSLFRVGLISEDIVVPLMVDYLPESISWSNVGIKRSIDEISTILIRQQQSNIPQFIIKYAGRLFRHYKRSYKSLLQHRQLVFSNTASFPWHENPPLRHSISFTVCNIAYPHLVDHLDDFLPLVVELSRHPDIDIVELGIRSIAHTVDNLNPTEIKWHKDDLIHVLFDTIQIHTFEEKLIEKSLPCLIRVLIAAEPNANVPLFHSTTREIMRALSEDRVQRNTRLCETYLLQSSILWKHMGILIVQHFKRLIPLITGYLSLDNDRLSSIALDIINILVIDCWPRISGHRVTIESSLIDHRQRHPNRSDSIDGILSILKSI